jgi:hypothetical protein
VTADIVQYRRDSLVRKLLNQPEQLLTLRAHGFSVRIVIARPGDRTRSGPLARGVSASGSSSGPLRSAAAKDSYHGRTMDYASYDGP